MVRPSHTLRKLTPALSLLAVIACAPLQTVTPDSRAQTMTTLQAGAISLDCTMACSWNWVTERERLRALDAAGDWESLALKVAQIGYQKDLAYYYLGRASEGLGYRDAALRYYRESFALATGNLRGPQCRAVAGDCMGVDLLAVLPGKLSPSRPAATSAKQSTPTQGQAVETAKSKQTSRPLSADSTRVRAASAAEHTSEGNLAQADAVCGAFNRIDAAAAGDFRALVPPTIPLPKDGTVDVPTQVLGTSGANVGIRPNTGGARLLMHVDVPGPVDTRTTKRYYKHWIETVVRCFPTAQRRTLTRRAKIHTYRYISHHEVFTLPSGNQLEAYFQEPLEPLVDDRTEGGWIALSLWKGTIPAEMLTDSESLPTASSTGAGTASSARRAPSDNKGATSSGGSLLPDKISIYGKNNQKIMVNNFFPKGDQSSGSAEIAANNGKMWISYGQFIKTKDIKTGKASSMFSIVVGGNTLKEVQKNQKDAELFLLRTVGIDKENACKLEVQIGAPRAMTGRFDYSSEDTFSFCPDGRLIERMKL